MITLLYSTLATPTHPFADATLLVNDDGHYLLSIPAMEDWTSAEVQIAQYPPVDVEIEASVIEIEGEFFEPEEDLWVTISIAKGANFGGSYRFPLRSFHFRPKCRSLNLQNNTLESVSIVFGGVHPLNTILFFGKRETLQFFGHTFFNG